jgi:hypothetical protein
VSFLARKREHFFIINNYKKYFFDEEGSHKYFPETFLIPEDYARYKRTHSVRFGAYFRNIRKECM